MGTIIADRHWTENPDLRVTIEDNGVVGGAERYIVTRLAANRLAFVQVPARSFEAARGYANGLWKDGVTTLRYWAAQDHAAQVAVLAGDPFTAEPPAAEVALAKPAPLGQGDICQLDGEVYKIHRGTSGNLYAKRLILPDVEGELAWWQYAKGMIYKLGPEHRMTGEAAAEFGRTYGWCCNCGKLLTHPKSIERGMGPVCYGKWYDEA